MRCAPSTTESARCWMRWPTGSLGSRGKPWPIWLSASAWRRRSTLRTRRERQSSTARSWCTGPSAITLQSRAASSARFLSSRPRWTRRRQSVRALCSSGPRRELREEYFSARPRRLVDRHVAGERHAGVLAREDGIAVFADGVNHVLELDAMTHLRIRPGIVGVADGEMWLHVRHGLAAHAPEQDLVILRIGHDRAVLAVQLEP